MGNGYVNIIRNSIDKDLAVNELAYILKELEDKAYEKTGSSIFGEAHEGFEICYQQVGGKDGFIVEGSFESFCAVVLGDNLSEFYKEAEEMAKQSMSEYETTIATLPVMVRVRKFDEIDVDEVEIINFI